MELLQHSELRSLYVSSPALKTLFFILITIQEYNYISHYSEATHSNTHRKDSLAHLVKVDKESFFILNLNKLILNQCWDPPDPIKV